MLDILLVAGLTAGTALALLLVLTVADAPLRVWPTPMKLTPMSVAFWGLFRGLHVIALALVLTDAADLDEGPLGLRIAAFLVAAVALVMFHVTGMRLGQENLYCGREGLETRGIYRFSRNPQYAVAMPGLVFSAIAAWSLPAVLVTSLLATAYMLMAFAEEPWLEQSYGRAYEHYREDVPRFYHWARLWHVVRLAMTSELARARS